MRGLPESLGELPVVCLAEEIDTPGDGQIQGLVTVAGNPVLSTPDAARLDAALAALDAYVAVDPYVNETTRHADVILPVPSALQRGHYDLFLSQLALRNVARYTPAGPAPRSGPARRVGGAGPPGARRRRGGARVGTTPRWSTRELVRSMAAAAVADPSSPVQGRDADELIAALGDRRGPERLLDLMLRTGPYGDGFGADPDGLSLDALLAAPARRRPRPARTPAAGRAAHAERDGGARPRTAGGRRRPAAGRPRRRGAGTGTGRWC